MYIRIYIYIIYIYICLDLARHIIVDFMPCKLCRGFAYAKIFMAALMEDVHLFVEGKGMIVLPSIPIDQWFFKHCLNWIWTMMNVDTSGTIDQPPNLLFCHFYIFIPYVFHKIRDAWVAAVLPGCRALNFEFGDLEGPPDATPIAMIGALRRSVWTCLGFSFFWVQ